VEDANVAFMVLTTPFVVPLLSVSVHLKELPLENVAPVPKGSRFIFQEYATPYDELSLYVCVFVVESLSITEFTGILHDAHDGPTRDSVSCMLPPCALGTAR
jgi:hypothetical protein